ncbi:hypothetical protein [Flagellimonas algicola]|uniref:GLPGLI family protein n=1 Tax=Flagellimonas algicola TaxID=2583815 RepID=A0ABY2WK15_9FLAO|nr:hypothetical protein [Allomuricauda algicola]TMU55169.1 hypothetical protein FGG15_13380 [Allomuricauda algicola]
MKKTLLNILTLFISLSSIAQINGKFKHNICEFGPNCFVYEFKKDGTFQYKYHQDILGSGTLTGTYMKTGDTLKLNPDKVLFASESKIIEENYKNPDSTKIQISLQRLSPKEKVDIDRLHWCISINDGKYIETNENGMILIPKTKVEKIEIKDIFQIKLKNSEPMLKLTDSIFRPKTDKNYIEIFASESEENGDLAITEWMTKAFILKGGKLYPLTFEPEVGFLGQKKTYYRKIE